ncbi:pseudouridine synthase [Gemmobacter serpentinus]|uniref:pseudouridine synthase n=1 Tax=Gemmobacter serpentinus TaxID=2652247 RepID=UPI00124E716B|nr:pseudouridine synthase [Gemmobacter serpentinus]
MPEQDKPKPAHPKPARPKPAAARQPAKPEPVKSADTPEGERIAKVLSRAGVASRREAERLIEAGEVRVNGKIITSPALNVTERDRITVSGQPLAAKEPVRVWLYYKPEGLVTSASDEKGRQTVFDSLPEDMPRVMSVGRLDLNSEGLLLLTNDGGLKRQLELPSTGWLRKYRVRVHGNPTDPDLEPLRKGIEVDGERFQPMQVVLDRVQGANAWLTIGLREGKNREIRRAMSEIGLTVNRLIRISYGPFRLNELQPGEVEEIRPRVLKDQLGFDPNGDEEPPPPAKAARPGERVRTLSRSGKTRPDEEDRPAARGRAPRPVAGERAAAGARPGTGERAARGKADATAKPGRITVTRSGAKPRPAAGDETAPARSKTARATAGAPPARGTAGAKLRASADRFLDNVEAKPRRSASSPRPPEPTASRSKAGRDPSPRDRGPTKPGRPTASRPGKGSGPRSR